eukprot:TRINITY_DN1759_c2_g1_i1.p1 TRINITY_DN1759_c2_g1~~TRINITY_DN1759_c2_g1_i1.p1  ORF type:complete len:416 (+),score=150.48 TRINITY_DN1759_c2_g1_i1:67-1314(+)
MGGKGKHQKKLADIKKKAAGAWTRDVAKRARVAQFTDLSMDLVLAALSFVTKRPGQASYFDDGLYHLNTVCRQWFCMLEHARFGMGEGVHASCHRWLRERLARAGASPGVGPMSAGVVPPAVLDLGCAGIEVDASAGGAGCKEAIVRFTAAGGCKSVVTQWLMHAYHLHRSVLASEKAYAGYVPTADLPARRKEVAKLSDLIRFCVAEGHADLNVLDKAARSLLHFACLFGDAASAKLLIQQHGAALQQQDRHGQTPLHVVAANGTQDIVNFILGRSDAAVSQILAKKDMHNRTPLQCASSFHHVHCSQAISKRLRGLTNKLSESRDDDDDDDDAPAVKPLSSSSLEESSLNHNDSWASNSSGSNEHPPHAKDQAPRLTPTTSTRSVGKGKKKQQQAQHFDAAEQMMFAYDDRHW